MLNNIPKILSPDLVHVLMDMGHGEEIVIADANFPGAEFNDHVLRADGHGIPEILEAILKLMPLDPYNDWQFALMNTLGDDPTPEIWPTYRTIIENAEPEHHTEGHFDRFDFYDQARKARAVLITGETALYGNIILKKGVVV
ncbi:fucose isomerase [Corynebacterium sp. CCM 9185]|uniref:Fucose isomerase n=1 Tax=Corynebacterium marambiense TaxID=2765364 RepID=A0ABS0VYA4_9CORY|nr:RbsD/FucU domain-containing protein [Corynebacterium marambiense]MBI9001734.1 fucose isomerase [Corynebacterium marambiense]MCK7662198.1 fucose isomerase [Corynebacterium marambiense]MCX7541468.1 fucose isomerase [Corynebacterium marambiense]